MAQEQLQEMSFWDHIDALRSVLVRIVVVLVVAAVALFGAMPYLFDNVILAPCHGDFVLYRLFERMTSSVSWLPGFTTAGFEVELINIKLASQFFIHMSTSFWLALVLMFPLSSMSYGPLSLRHCILMRSVVSRPHSSLVA